MKTIRQQLKELLSEGEWNSIELSQELSIQEREIFDHLEHVKRSLGNTKLIISPYCCLDCDYLFRNRSRLDRPGRCPKCKGSHIRMASYSIRP
jgi:predicted Zn-ribbon and HTH transcriptional regulator